MMMTKYINSLLQNQARASTSLLIRFVEIEGDGERACELESFLDTVVQPVRRTLAEGGEGGIGVEFSASGGGGTQEWDESFLPQ